MMVKIKTSRKLLNIIAIYAPETNKPFYIKENNFMLTLRKGYDEPN